MKHNPNNLPPATHNRHPIIEQEESSGEELIARCAAACRINFDQAASAMAFYDENFSSSDQMNTASLAQALQERDRKWWQSIERIFDLLVVYQSKQTSADVILMSTRALAMAMGFSGVACATSPPDLAQKLNLSKILGQSGKQTVWKCYEKFITQLKLVNIPGQRDEEARAKMSEKRKAQLKTTP